MSDIFFLFVNHPCKVFCYNSLSRLTQECFRFTPLRVQLIEVLNPRAENIQNEAGTSSTRKYRSVRLSFAKEIHNQSYLPQPTQTITHFPKFNT